MEQFLLWYTGVALLVIGYNIILIAMIELIDNQDKEND